MVFHSRSPAISLKVADCQLTLWMLLLHCVSALQYFQVVLLGYFAGVLNGDFHHLAQVQYSSSGTEDRNPKMYFSRGGGGGVVVKN